MVKNIIQNSTEDNINTLPPVKHAHLKYVTWKTAFLIAITSFRRCSDLQALCIGEESVVVQKKGVAFIRHGLAKQDRPKHFGSKIFIPSYSIDL
jgi:hypothetical protein